MSGVSGGSATGSGSDSGNVVTGSGVGGSNTGVASGASSGWGSGSTSGTESDAGAILDSGSVLAPVCAESSSDAGPLAPSCAPGGPGMTNCGVCGESCCTSLEVPGGTYYRTYTNGGTGPRGEADPATVSGFRLDKYLVTVGRFRQFVNAWSGGWMPAGGSGKHTYLNGGLGLVTAGDDAGVSYEPGWVASDDGNIGPTNASLAAGSAYATWTASASSQENLPINYVNWWEAYAFCIWDGGFLPSEAEWEYAAAGGSQQREYPWGSTDPGANNQYAIYSGPNCYYPDAAACAGEGNIAPVGTTTLGAGLWGQLDLAGDLWEWPLDWYAAYRACTDCADFTVASYRVFLGGSFGSGVYELLPPFRVLTDPESRSSNAGFRCSRSP